MDCVIVNAEGMIYAGFQEGKPVWHRSKKESSVLSEEVADKCLSQLTQLGFTDIAKRNSNEVARKWVPKSLDAAKVPA